MTRAIARVHQPHAAARGARDLAAAARSARLLPRHLEIIYEINRRFLDEVRARFPGDDGARRADVARSTRTARSACAWRTSPPSAATRQRRRRAALAAAHARPCSRDFAELWPERFTNVTNGVTPRRFVALANPRLAALITEAIGDGWLTRPRPAARARAARRRRRVPGALARASSARTRQASPRWLRGDARARRRSAALLRRAVQAHPRVQAPAPEPAARRSRSTIASARRRDDDRAAHVPLRRQGRAGLPRWRS